MADAFNNPTSHSDMIPEMWDTAAILAADDHTLNPLLGLAFNDSAKLAKGGDTINYPKQSDVDLVTISQIAETDVAQFSASTKRLIIDTHKGNPILVTSQADALANQDIMEGLFQQAGFAVGKEMEVDLAALYASAGETVSGTSAANITEAQIREAKLKLDLAKAPRQGRWMTTSIEQMDELSSIAAFRSTDSLPGHVSIIEGMVGRIHGFDIFMSHSIFSTTSAGVQHNLAGVSHPNVRMNSLVRASGAFKPSRANVVQRIVPEIGMRVTFSWDGKRFGDIMSVESLFGTTALRDEWLVDIQTADG